MKTFGKTFAAVIALGVSSVAFAADNSSTEVNAVVPQSCEIDSQSSSLTLGAVDEVIAGEFTYSCNFTGSPSLSFSSAKGGVQNTGGPDEQDPVDYGIYLNDTAPGDLPSAWLQASEATEGVTFEGITTTTAPNVTKAPSFAVGLSQPLTVAGTYTDTLTISIAP